MEWLIYSALLWQMGEEDIDLNLVVQIIFFQVEEWGY